MLALRSEAVTPPQDALERVRGGIESDETVDPDYWRNKEDALVALAEIESYVQEQADWINRVSTSSIEAATAADKAEERAKRAEAEREDLARLLDEAIEREKVVEAEVARLREALRFWVDRADHLEERLDESKQYVRARGAVTPEYKLGRALADDAEEEK